MKHIAIISSSIRVGRKSHRVALYFQDYLTENKLATVEILDLYKYDFPLFKEKLSELKNPAKKVLEFTEKIKNADAIIIVTPEYNGGYVASLKNIIDLLYSEWHHKPMAISTVSGGVFGGNQALVLLQFSLWKIKAIVAPVMFPVGNVEDKFDEKGKPTDKEETDKLAKLFTSELIWITDLLKKNLTENTKIRISL